jgi:hypothetical protein
MFSPATDFIIFYSKIHAQNDITRTIFFKRYYFTRGYLFKKFGAEQFFLWASCGRVVFEVNFVKFFDTFRGVADEILS